MRTLDDIVDGVIEMLDTTLNVDHKVFVKKVYSETLMDMPLQVPTITVGVESAKINASPLSSFSGTTTLGDVFSAPADIKLSTNIYLPSEVDGRAGLAYAGFVVSAFLNSDLPVGEIYCDKIRYNNTFMCRILPMTVHLHDRIY